MSEPVQSVQEGRVLRIRMNRAERRNALSRELCSGLLAVFRAANRDEGVGAILLESSGPVFCGGWDLDEAPSAEDLIVHDSLLNVADEIGKPMVVAVQGPALGPGVALVANAVVAVAAQGVTFAMTDIRTGRFPYIAYGPLARAVGERRAIELCVTGRVFTAPEAMAWGLVHHTAPAFEFDDRALGIAGQLAASKGVLEGLGWVQRREAAGSTRRRSALEVASHS